jgi:hypothetical protein
MSRLMRTVKDVALVAGRCVTAGVVMSVRDSSHLITGALASYTGVGDAVDGAAVRRCVQERRGRPCRL